jgi:hypothetical protein
MVSIILPYSINLPSMSAIMAPSLLVFLHSEINLYSEFQDVLQFVSDADAAAIVETH